MRYKIADREFFNKAEITEFCRELISRNIGQNLIGADLKFMMALLEHRKEKIANIDYLSVALDSYKKSFCLWVHSQTLTGVKTIRDVSWTKCVANLPFSSEHIVDYIFRFGKYKDQSIYDIKDDNYLIWYVDLPNLDRGSKIQIGQFIKWGYIPYNPVFYKKKTHKT